MLEERFSSQKYSQILYFVEGQSVEYWCELILI